MRIITKCVFMLVLIFAISPLGNRAEALTVFDFKKKGAVASIQCLLPTGYVKWEGLVKHYSINNNTIRVVDMNDKQFRLHGMSCIIEDFE